MFDTDLESLSTADLLESAAAHRAEANWLDARLLQHAQIYADRHHPDVCPTRPGRRPGGGRERAVVLGGEGCPEIAEFAAAEFGVMVGISAGAAADLIGEALALRHRFPLTWARVLAGEATPWKARKIATACLELSEEAARDVDRRVARVVDSLTPIRLENIVEAAKKHADPDGARKKAEEKKRERGVYLGRSDEHGTKTMFIKASSGAVIRHDATIAGIADALKIFGDTRSVQARRADAVGIIADPRYTEELLNEARQQLRNTPSGSAGTPAAAAGGSQPADTASVQRSASTVDPDGARGAASASDRGNATSGQSSSGGDVSTADPASVRAEGSAAEPERGSECGRPARGDKDYRAYSGDEDLLNDWPEPGWDDEADRDSPHPGDSDVPDPFDAPFKETPEPFDPGPRLDRDDGEPLDADARRALDARLARIRHDAHTNPRSSGRVRPGQTEIYVHLTDHTLATGSGVLRVEGVGPLLASQLSELVGHGPYLVKPVIDLHDAASVDAYEIPDRIRERVKLTYPVELFPYGIRETHATMDLDHIEPYDPLGSPGQTNTANLAPLRRFPHRVKTHGRWKVRRLDYKTLEWITPNGFTFHVDPTGTHRAANPPPDA
jgi:hypothetical protein